jgi:hypothetical protein
MICWSNLNLKYTIEAGTMAMPFDIACSVNNTLAFHAKNILVSRTEDSLIKTVTLGVINRYGVIWGLKANMKQRPCKSKIDLKISDQCPLH